MCNNKLCWLFVWIGISIIWFLYLLAYYPGIFSYDISAQWDQYFGFTQYSTHHPIIHTLLMGWIIDMGKKILGDYNKGGFCYCLIQLLFFSGVVSYTIYCINRLISSKKIIIVTTIYFALFPVYPLLGISTTKDTYFSENKRPFHNFGNDLVRKSINILFNNDIKDIMTGYRAFSYEFVKTFPILSEGFEIETEMSIHAVDKNMYVENVVINYRDRPEGSVSKLNTYSDGIKVLRTIIRLYRTYKPMRFFGAIAALLAVLSVVFSMPVIMTYFRTGLVPQFPTLIVCGFTMIAAIQSFFAGMQLHTSVQKNRQDFEMNLQQVKILKNLLEG